MSNVWRKSITRYTKNGKRVPNSPLKNSFCLQADEDRCKVYGVDQYQRERQKPLTAHLDAYENYLRSKGNTEKHVFRQRYCIEELILATKAKTLDDLDGHRIGQTLTPGPTHQIWRFPGRGVSSSDRGRI